MISRRKIFYPISDSLRNYLAHYGRLSEVPLVYDELLRFSGSIPYENPAGEETLWLEVMYPPEVMAELRGRGSAAAPSRLFGGGGRAAAAKRCTTDLVALAVVVAQRVALLPAAAKCTAPKWH